MFTSLIEKAYAAGEDITIPSISFFDDPKITTMADLVSQILKIVLWVGGALAVVFLIYSGILYITAAGNPDAAKKGQQGIINSIIGIIIVAFALIIVQVVIGVGKKGAV